jgi:hypothetical protein
MGGTFHAITMVVRYEHDDLQARCGSDDVDPGVAMRLTRAIVESPDAVSETGADSAVGRSVT